MSGRRPKPEVQPLRGVFGYVAGDAISRVLAFGALVWVARSLGVQSFGSLEFALAVLTWLLVAADGGLEIWATREVAKGADLARLVGCVVPLRLALSAASSVFLLALLPAFPAYPSLKTLLLVFAACMPLQALNLKWVLLGREEMRRVGIGLVVAQAVSLVGALALVRHPSDLWLVPIVRFGSDLLSTVWFGTQFRRLPKALPVVFRWRGNGRMLRLAAGYGAAHALALASFNVDALLLGFMGSAAQVGLYAAAYKPVVAGLALPLAFFMGLYPLLSRMWSRGEAHFQAAAGRSMRWAAAFALPVGLLGVAFAEDVLRTLFGSAYVGAARALQYLSVAAVFVVLRGTYRRGLLAAGLVKVDLRCAAVATGINIALNLLLIPTLGIEGAAIATLASEAIWLALLTLLFSRCVTPLPMVASLLLPLPGMLAMVGTLLALSDRSWWLQGVVASIAYALVTLASAHLGATRNK